MQRIGIIVSVLGALGLSQAVAETAAPAPYPDVAFKRIGVPVYTMTAAIFGPRM